MEDEKIINKNLQAEINNTIHRNILPEEQEGINQKIEDASIINSDEETSSERKRNKAKSDTSSDYSWSGSDHKSVDQIPNKAKKDLGCFKRWKEMFLNEDSNLDKKISKSFRC